MLRLFVSAFGSLICAASALGKQHKAMVLREFDLHARHFKHDNEGIVSAKLTGFVRGILNTVIHIITMWVLFREQSGHSVANQIKRSNLPKSLGYL